MAGTVVADTLQAASTSTLVLKNGVASTPPTIQDSAGTEIGTFCRAWVNFDGAAVTNPASMTGVRASFNVSSVLDNGLGDYTINFTTAMPDANFSSVGMNGDNATGSRVIHAVSRAAGNIRVFTTNGAGTAADYSNVCIAIFR